MSDKFEQQVKDLLDEVGIDPRQESWEKVRSQIRPAQRRRRFAAFWLLPLLLLMGGAVYYFSLNHEEPSVIAEQKRVPKDEKIIGSNTDQSSDQSNSQFITEPAIHVNAEQAIATIIYKQEKAVQPYVKTPVTDDHKWSRIIVETERNVKDKIEPAAVGEDELGPDFESYIPEEKQNKEPETFKTSLVNETVDSMAANASLVSTNKPKNKRVWNTGIIAEFGAAGRPVNWGKLGIEKENVFANQLGSAVPTITEERVLKNGLSAGIGVTAGKNLSKSFSFNTALLYQYQSFSAAVERYNVQSMTSSSPPALWYQATTSHHLHMLNLSTSISYDLLNKDKYKAGLGTGIDNMLLIALRTAKEQTVNNGIPVSQAESTKSASGYRKWQPSISGHAYVELPLGKQSLQFSPFIRYSLVEFEKASGKNHLGSFGIQLKYFIK